jgi:hypothetical protein
MTFRMNCERGHLLRPALAVSLVVACSAGFFIPRWKSRPAWEGLARAAVHRVSFDACLTASDHTKSMDQLAHHRSLVELCTIRAPHDGFVIYANGTFRRIVPAGERILILI